MVILGSGLKNSKLESRVDFFIIKFHLYLSGSFSKKSQFELKFVFSVYIRFQRDFCYTIEHKIIFLRNCLKNFCQIARFSYIYPPKGVCFAEPKNVTILLTYVSSPEEKWVAYPVGVNLFLLIHNFS